MNYVNTVRKLMMNLFKIMIFNFDPKIIRTSSPKTAVENQKILKTENPDIIRLEKDFMDAIHKDDLKRIEKLYHEIGTVNFDIDNNMTPLNYSILERKYLIFKWLLEHNADVNYFSEKGMYPLDTAVSMKEREMINILLEAGANPNLTQNHNIVTGRLEPPLAAASGKIEIMIELLKYGADINYIEDDETILGNAIEYGRVRVIELLRKCGAKTYVELITEKIRSGELILSEKERDNLAKLLMTRAERHTDEFRCNQKLALQELVTALDITKNEKLKVEIKNKIESTNALVEKLKAEPLSLGGNFSAE